MFMSHEGEEKKVSHIYCCRPWPLLWILVSIVLLFLCIIEAYVIYQSRQSLRMMGNGNYNYENTNSMMNVK